MRFQLPARAPGTGRAPKKPIRLDAEAAWYGFLTLVCVAVFLVALVSASSVNSAFCGTCHQKELKALAKTQHGNIGCDSCHVRGGVIGLVENRLRVVAMVARAPLSLVTPDSGGRPPMDNSRCVECHRKLLSTTVEVGRLRMNHHAPEKDGMFCISCHRGSAHPVGDFEGASYTMETCLGCHSAGTDNLDECATCHIGEGERSGDRVTPWRITHGAGWQKSHGMGDLKTCRTCHAQDYCVGCHKLRLPHAENFLATHGKEVLARETGREDCVTCHKGAMCDNCHGMAMPHPDGFLKRHKQELKKSGKPACMRCHAESSCQQCHERHTHPGVPQDQLKKLRENPVRLP